MNCRHTHGHFIVTTFCLIACSTSFAVAQNSSLFQQPDVLINSPQKSFMIATNMQSRVTPESGVVLSPAAGSPPPMAGANWYYMPPPQPRVLRIHDSVTVRVDEISRMTSEGRATQRKNGSYDAIIKEWLTLEGLKAIRKAPQSSGDPAISGQVNETFRATSDVQTRESLSFNIAAEITDIRPNGTLVLEAHKTITNNDIRFEYSLSGSCQASDIGPDNVILSRDILDLKIDKRESGQTRDGYRRGWFHQIFNRLSPF